MCDCRILSFLPILSVLWALGSSVAAQTNEVKNLFINENPNAVQNNPGRKPVFTLSEPKHVSLIRTYHYNNGRGSQPGEISIVDSQGRLLGVWKAAITSRYYWTVTPNAVFPAGTYTIVDSDPATWAHNSATGGAGFALVNGSDVHPSAKGPVNSLLAQQQQIAQSRKGEVKPLIVRPNTFGATWAVNEALIKCGGTFTVFAFTTASSELRTIGKFSVELELTDTSNGRADTAVAMEQQSWANPRNWNGQEVYMARFRGDKPFTGTARIMLVTPGGRRVVHTFTLTVTP